ncbi:MAG: hypothetical protein AAFO91_09935, partial [Bacteroidota bacterium]
VQHSCACEFLWGSETDEQHIRLVRDATATNSESEIKDVHTYRKDGESLLCRTRKKKRNFFSGHVMNGAGSGALN